MTLDELNDLSVHWRLLGAICTAYLIWSAVARDRILLHRRRKFYDRYPPDGHLFFSDGSAPPEKYMKVEKWSGSVDPRLVPVGLQSFTRIDGVVYETTSGDMVPYGAMSLPSPCILQHEGMWRLVGGNEFVEGWVKHTPRGIMLLREGESLPRWRVERDSMGNWSVPDDGGTWLGNLVSCVNCLGFWLAVVSALIVVASNSGLVVLLGLCAAAGVGVRILNRLLSH